MSNIPVGLGAGDASLSKKNQNKGIHQVKVVFSRHAKRRAKLYKIPESTVKKILEGIELSQGEHEIIEDVAGFELPLKIVVAVEGKNVTVITNYPLKKGRKQ